MLTALLPLFFAMPVDIGGLGFSPPTIGYIWGCYGAFTGTFNIFFFAKMLRWFGEKRIFIAGVSVFAPCFLLMPIMSLCARQWGVGPLVWALVVVELLLLVLMDMSYGEPTPSPD